MPILIKKLNEMLRGWGNYHRHVVASEAFSRIDNYVYEELWRMLCRRHSNKPKKWLASKYWQSTGGKWVFTASGITKHRKRLYQVMRLGSLGIRRYIIIEADANPSARICRLFLAAQARQGVALTPDDVGSGILGHGWR